MLIPPRNEDVDQVVLDAALQGRIRRNGISLTPAERVWLVAELTRRGRTVQDISQMTCMSRRTVQRHRRAASLQWPDQLG